MLKDLSLSPLPSGTETASSIILPASLNRRNLLTRSAALGAASQLGLLGTTILGSSSAHATSVTYVNKEVVATATHFVNGTEYQWAVVKYFRSNGQAVHYCITRRNGTNDKWRGIKLFLAQSDGEFFNQFEANNLTVTYNSLAVDNNIADWNDELRRNLADISVPMGAQEVTPVTLNTVSNFVGKSYWLNNVYYLKFYFREFTTTLGWTTPDVRTCSGQSRTDLVNLVNIVNEKVKVHKAAYGAPSVALAAAGGCVIAGGVVAHHYTKSEIPIVAILGGVAMVLIGGGTVYVASATARAAVALAVANLMVKAEEVYSGGALT